MEEAAMNSKQPLTRQEVKSLLEKAHELTWSVQGMGFFRYYVSDTLRLHVWDARFMEPLCSTLHTHPWDFVSYVYSGCILDLTYEDWRLDLRPGYGPTGEEYRRLRIQCGENARPVGNLEPCRLVAMPGKYWVQGQYYGHRKEIVHESVAKVGTVTLVERTFFEDRDHAFVYHRPNRQWVPARPRAATLPEKRMMQDMALDRWVD